MIEDSTSSEEFDVTETGQTSRLVGNFTVDCNIQFVAVTELVRMNLGCVKCLCPIR